MTHSITTEREFRAQRASMSALRVVGWGLVVTVVYPGMVFLWTYLFGLDGDLSSFLLWATPAIPLFSFAIATGVLAARTPRLFGRVVAGVACAASAWLTFVVVSFAWTFNMTNWLVW